MRNEVAHDALTMYGRNLRDAYKALYERIWEEGEEQEYESLTRYIAEVEEIIAILTVVAYPED